MSFPSVRHVARLLLPQPVRDAFGRLYWHWHNWWLWRFPVNPDFYIFVIMSFFQTKIRGKPVIAVYQPGRVGSTSVTVAIRSANVGLTFHAHSLSPDLRMELVPKGVTTTPKQEETISKYEHVARCLRWYLHRKGPMRIIVLLRDPIDHALSHFFYNFISLAGRSLAERPWTYSDLLRLYWVKNAFTGYTIFEYWFEKELQRYTGLDVFAQPFDRERGWQVYNLDNLLVLVMKIELDVPTKNSVLSSFLDHKNLQISSINRGEDQKYASAYHLFREKFSLKQERLDRIYTGRYASHFYTENEITGFIQKWGKK